MIHCKFIWLNNTLNKNSIPILERMLRIRRSLGTVCCKSDYTPEDIKPLQDEIQEIDNARVDGKFIGPDGSIPKGQEILNSLLEKLHYWSHDIVLACSDDFSPALQDVRERLLKIKNQLERLELTHKWTLRQTDLFAYQHQLHDIVQLKYNYKNQEGYINPKLMGKFVDSKGVAPEGQILLEFLLHKCYRMIFVLLSESVPVSEALTPVYNQLTSVRQCLLAVKNINAPCSIEELYPYAFFFFAYKSINALTHFPLDTR